MCGNIITNCGLQAALLSERGNDKMNLLLVLAFLFFIGSVIGWVIELIFRRFFSKNNPERKWINPGFCVGPYLPLYGSGLCVLYLMSGISPYIDFGNKIVDQIVLLLAMALAMTIIEYIAGLISYKGFHVRLWDYSKEWGNIQGIICPKFSLIWGVLGVAYYYLIHPNILDALDWLSKNLAFSFFIGMFYGVFIIDLVYSANLITKIKKISDENNFVVKYEELKTRIRSYHSERKSKYRFFQPFRSDSTLAEHIKAMKAEREEQREKKKASKSKNK